MLILLAVVAGACAAQDTTGGAAQPSPSPSIAATELVITVSDGGAAPARTWKLSCEPAAGTHPNVADACAFVAKASMQLLAPVPTGQMCTKIYGGPEVATITGTWRGEPVSARLARNDGCEIARWDNLKRLIGAAGN